MSDCCDNNCALDARRVRQRGTLRIVLGINGVMFLVIAAAALYGESAALLADSLDNLGDAFTYGLSLYAVSRSSAVKAKVALFKGGLIFLAACAVVAQIAYKFFVPSVPIFEVMGAFSLLGLIANSLCLYLLWRHRHEDVNMSSVWGVFTKRHRVKSFGVCGGGSGLAHRFRLARYTGCTWSRIALDALCDSSHFFSPGRTPFGNVTTPSIRTEKTVHVSLPFFLPVIMNVSCSKLRPSMLSGNSDIIFANYRSFFLYITHFAADNSN